MEVDKQLLIQRDGMDVTQRRYFPLPVLSVVFLVNLVADRTGNVDLSLGCLQ